jgi:hypothetical protein
MPKRFGIFVDNTLPRRKMPLLRGQFGEILRGAVQRACGVTEMFRFPEWTFARAFLAIGLVI